MKRLLALCFLLFIPNASVAEPLSVVTGTLNNGQPQVAPVGTGSFGSVPMPTASRAATMTSTTLQSAATSNGVGMPMAIGGMNSLTIANNCAGCSGGTQLNFLVSKDGTNYVPKNCQPSGGVGTPVAYTQVAGLTGWSCDVTGWYWFEESITGYSAGTIAATADASPLPVSPIDALAALANISAGSIPTGANVVGGFTTVHTTPNVTDGVQQTDAANLPSGAMSGTCSTSCNGTSLIAAFDTTGAKSIELHTTAIGSGATIHLQTSDDPNCPTASNWVDSAPVSTGNFQSGPTTVNMNFVATFDAPVTAHCERVQFASYTSGTYTMEGYLRAVPDPVARTTGSVQIVPPGANNLTQITASATGTTAATAATLSGTSGKTTFLCGFSIGANATSATSGNATVTGTISGTLNFTQGVAASPAVAQTSLPNIGTYCIPASGQNTGIVVNSTAAGTGGVTSVSAWGYQQ